MLQLQGISKDYKVGDGYVHALKGVSLDFRDNEFVAVLGPSGCGKTTLLNIVGGLDSYSAGDLIIDGVSTRDFNAKDWDAYRNHRVGFVFQSYNLIGHQTVLSNVELALKLSGISRRERRKRATEALEKVGLGDQLKKKPNMLSGGQMQRVAIARALVNDPAIVLADEPTGALDSQTSIQIMELLKEVAKDRLVVMVTHNPELAQQYATRIVRLKDGVVEADSMPVTAGELAAVEAAGKPRGTRLGLGTALGLSFSNLLTKKGRTLLTAFAGAIGITGIALILALSNGVNNYIKDIESGTMTNYPIELEKQAVDINSLMGLNSDGLDDEEEDFDPITGGYSWQEIQELMDPTVDHDNDGIYSHATIADSVEMDRTFMVSNDLRSFDAYLRANYDQVEPSITAVEYGYNISPHVYRLDTSRTSAGAGAGDGTDAQVKPTVVH
ncbi:MAG: ABC transporter ATP-binding protein, partial [Coriobacteriales bacterium]|nr:ABC transporter ATP-binding protein [Coriobacteriales bacterium]